MKIQILGSGCQTCQRLFELTNQAVKELGIEADVEHVKDVSKIIELGIMQAPVLTINGKPMLIGVTSDIEKIKSLLLKNKK